MQITNRQPALNREMKLRCRDAGIIGFLIGTLEGLRYQVSSDVRTRIDRALEEVRHRELSPTVAQPAKAEAGFPAK